MFGKCGEDVIQYQRVPGVLLQRLCKAFPFNPALHLGFPQLAGCVVRIHIDREIIAFRELLVAIQLHGHQIPAFRQIGRHIFPKGVGNLLLPVCQCTGDAFYILWRDTHWFSGFLHFVTLDGNRALFNAAAVNMFPALFPLVEQVQRHFLGNCQIDAFTIYPERFASSFPPLLDFLPGYNVGQEVLDIHVVPDLRILGSPGGGKQRVPSFAPFVEIVKRRDVFNVQQAVYRTNRPTAFHLGFLHLQSIIHSFCLGFQGFVPALRKQLVGRADRVLYSRHSGPYSV